METLVRAYEIGKGAGVRHVYVGGAAGCVGEREHTLCPSCDCAVVERVGYAVRSMRLDGGACGRCGYRLAGIWA